MNNALTIDEARAYADQLSVVEYCFDMEINSITNKVHYLMEKYPGRVFSVNDIQNLT